jgi:rare lipoprotein A
MQVGFNYNEVLKVKFFSWLIISICVLFSDYVSAESSTVLVSWYGGKFFQGQPMKNGRPFNGNDPTIAAHLTLPMGTRVMLCNPIATGNGICISVTIQDRGPYIKGRTFDLSEAAAEKLGFKDRGLAQLEVLDITPPSPRNVQGT